MTQTLIVPLSSSFPISDFKILGIFFLDRIFLTAKKHGFKDLILLSRKIEVKLPERFLIVFPNFFLSDRVWKLLSQLELEPETVIASDGTPSFCLVRTMNPQFILKSLTESLAIPFEELERWASAFLKNLDGSLKWRTIPLKQDDWVLFRNEKESPAVEEWFLRGLFKESEGFMSKHVERKISLAVTKRLVNTSITPNLMTVFSALLGLGGALFFIADGKWLHLTGALLFWSHSVLDGCDGEIARLKFLESRLGGLLDFWSDNLVHTAVFGCIAYGLKKKYNLLLSLLLGSCAIMGTLSSAALVYWTTMRNKKGTGPVFRSVVSAQYPHTGLSHEERGAVERVTDFLARRDFIYLVILLSYFDKIELFLWMGAIGAPLYFLILLWLNLKPQ